jgi:hypothetical protein
MNEPTTDPRLAGYQWDDSQGGDWYLYPPGGVERVPVARIRQYFQAHDPESPRYAADVSNYQGKQAHVNAETLDEVKRRIEGHIAEWLGLVPLEAAQAGEVREELEILTDLVAAAHRLAGRLIEGVTPRHERFWGEEGLNHLRAGRLKLGEARGALEAAQAQARQLEQAAAEG